MNELSKEIPKDLSSASSYLYLFLTDVKKLDLLKLSERDFINTLHHSLGRQIRNEWGLWKKEGPLYNSLNSLGFTHPDDMSSVILKYFYCKSNLLSINLLKEAEKYKNYWTNINKKLNCAFKLDDLYLPSEEFDQKYNLKPDHKIKELKTNDELNKLANDLFNEIIKNDKAYQETKKLNLEMEPWNHRTRFLPDADIIKINNQLNNPKPTSKKHREDLRVCRDLFDEIVIMSKRLLKIEEKNKTLKLENNDLKKTLVERSKSAFDDKFRRLLEDSVTDAINSLGWKLFVKENVKTGIEKYNAKCVCPEGCLPKLRPFYGFPLSESVSKHYGFTYYQHRSFQNAFDIGEDNGAPEAALGLLYRNKFLRHNKG